MAESIEWQDPVPRQRIDECFSIHFPRWVLFDQLLSSHRTFLLVCSTYVRGVSVAIGPRSSFHVTVPQGVMFGGAEQVVVERGECHNVEIGVESVEGTDEDGMTKDDEGHFMRTTPLTLEHVLSRVMWCKTMRTLTCEVCAVHTPVGYSGSHRL